MGLRHRVPTPQPSAPEAVIASIRRMVKKLEKEVGLDPAAPIGVGFPAVVIDGVTKSAANVDPSWIDFEADPALERATGHPVFVINDADAAGVAEMRYGAGVGQKGTVFLITLGTGTGSALFYDGMLVPNLELGHMEIRGRDAEKRSASAARIRRGLSWKAWAADLDEHLLAIEKLFSPRLFIIGGGVSKRSEKFIPRLTVKADVVPAKLLNDAGIVGAAMAAAERALGSRGLTADAGADGHRRRPRRRRGRSDLRRRRAPRRRDHRAGPGGLGRGRRSRGGRRVAGVRGRLGDDGRLGPRAAPVPLRPGRPRPRGGARQAREPAGRQAHRRRALGDRRRSRRSSSSTRAPRPRSAARPSR